MDSGSHRLANTLNQLIDVAQHRLRGGFWRVELGLCSRRLIHVSSTGLHYGAYLRIGHGLAQVGMRRLADFMPPNH